MPKKALKETAAGEDGDIVISGLSGKLPESSNIEEFKYNLLNGIDMVTDEPRRWEAGIYGLPERMAKMKDSDLEKFDDKFFSVHQKQAELMDPCMRMLLELTHEAIIDAGINPAQLRGSRTGVYIGLSFVETEHEIPNMEPSSINGYCLTGCARAMFANRISYTFDFKGPSFIVDTACSSSLVALNHAFADMRAGRCDYALVAGVNLILKPIFALQFLRLGIVSHDGACKTFDAAANGYARADTCAVVLLQRRKEAKRVYASILNVRTNTDGFKEQGVTFPDGRMQQALLQETYSEIGLNPDEVVYVEAHGSGTPVGDDQEANMLSNFFCRPSRSSPLLIGSVKSNMGHAEPASGVSALAKMIIAMEEGIIPKNLHYRTPNPSVPALVEGRLKVVDRNLPWQGGIVGLNSFGFGGANAHVVLKSHAKSKVPKTSSNAAEAEQSLRLVTCSGRTEEAVRQLLKVATDQCHDQELLTLINDIHSHPIPLHPFRGYAVLDASGSVKEEVLEYEEEERPIWFVYAGMGSQWASMAKDLMQLTVFKKSIQHCAKVLARVDFDLIDVLTRSTDRTFDNMLYSFVSVSAVQVALTDLLRTLDIRPDGIIGHSAGELGAAYMDGCLTAEQTVLAAYWRGRSVLDTPNLPRGKMAAVGLSWEQIESHIPKDCYPVCHNSDDNCTVSGPSDSMDVMVDKLKAEGIFVREVGSGGYAFHSPYIEGAAPMLRRNLEKLIKEPKKKSHRWLSTSVKETEWDTEKNHLASAGYFINNLISPVLFYQAIKKIPQNALIVEIAPHGLFRAILRSLSPQISYVSLMQRGHANNFEFLLSQLGRLFAAGGQPQILKISPSITYPVSRGTPMLGSLVGWDHSQKWNYPKFKGGRQTGQLSVELDLGKEEYAYLAGHTIDGRILFPATGYMTLAWMSLAQQQGLDYLRTPVLFEDVVFHRATILGVGTVVKLTLNFFPGSSAFEICEGSSLVASGKIRLVTNVQQEQLQLASLPGIAGSNKLSTKDIYKELRLRGYDYSGVFQGILESDIAAITGRLQWADNWISFMDTMLQFRILSNNIRELYVPTGIERVLIDPLKHLELAKKSQQKLTVNWHRNISVVKCGGVEIHKMKTAQTQRRSGGQSAPSLERYRFWPHIQHMGQREDHQKSRGTALAVAIQLIIENSNGAVKIKGVELAGTRTSLDTLSALQLLELIEREPVLVGDLTVVSTASSESELREQLKEHGIGVTAKDIADGAVDQQCHFVYSVDTLAKNSLKDLQHCLDSLKSDTGFLLLEEAASRYNIIGKEKLSKLKLVSVFEQFFGTDRVLVLARKPPIVRPTEALTLQLTNRQFKWVNELKNSLVKAQADQRNLYLVAQGEPHSGALGLVNCLKRESGGNWLRLYLILDEGLPQFSLEEPFYADQLAKDLAINVYRNGSWGTFRHLKMECQPPLLPVEQAYVNTLVKGDLSSLRWIESPRSSPTQTHLEPCTVYYAPLNFRDVMLASGKLGVDALPGDLAYQDCVLGLEFAGRDSCGRRIMAMVTAKSLATNCLANKNLLWEIPAKWTMEQASTVPCVYATVYYALAVRGQMKKGEKILIHAGSGGVGQAAISVALAHGLTVFTTVGSKEKHEFLLKRFPKLQARHIGNSRDTSFEQLIMTETHGNGVELVLNSLSEEKLQASIRCLALNGRFLEIGKFDLSNNTPMGMSVFLKNTSFHGILLDSVMEGEEEMQLTVAKLVTEGIKSGAVQPLPTTVFAEQEIEKAFRFMASGKHIGKVVIKVRLEEEQQAAFPRLRQIQAIPRSYMHPEKSYILVGGLGGFGLELANWLVSRGARFLVLNSRSGVKSGYQALMIRRWHDRGIQVQIDTNDVTTAVGCQRMLEVSNKLALVGGIFNLAAVLHDGLIEDQSAKNFEKVTAPKLLATQHLDRISRDICPALEYFVCFSSVSCGRGNLGQTNYGLANSTMERICEQRQEYGYPGTAIQWGAIGDTGLIIEHMGNNETVVGGTMPQRMTSCLETMDLFLQQPHPVMASMVVAEKRKAEQANRMSLIATIANIMGLRDVKSVSDKTTLFDLGMDSLMSTEIKQTLERHFDLVLSAQEIRQLTFSALRQIDAQEPRESVSSKSAATASPTASTVKEVARVEVQPQSDETRKVFAKEVLPQEVMVRLQSKALVASEDPAVFFLAPIEGFTIAVEALAASLTCPAYGLQCTEQVPLESIEACAAYYLRQIQKLQPLGPYHIVGYSYGCLLAHAIGVALEQRRFGVKVIMLDGAPTMASGYVQEAKKQTDDLNRQQSMTLAYFGALLADVDYNQLLQLLDGVQTWASKLDKLADTLAGHTNQTKEVIKKAACMFKQKLLLSESYKGAKQLQSDVVLIKSAEHNAIMAQDYGLKEICSAQIDMHVVKGTHRTFLKEPHTLQIIERVLRKRP
ncbi:fatty acid synthase [Drosophila rhopaloa]|uniref:Fatty acid synthase n=1 Tax=Drosophila rhopaloa TaxID=1041015 RepID=A0A6P4FB55_DRORH|nr:fatty acid synthase [Drosophila rhopaloa]XP_016987665.1 fatty acid synthase [Drosophila rhopaloa]